MFPMDIKSATKATDGHLVPSGLIDIDTLTPAKAKTIKEVYNDPAGFGTPAQTYKDAKKKDKTITLADVKKWFAQNVQRKSSLKGVNSFVAQDPKQELQIDLFFITERQLPNQRMRIGMMAVNAFTKKMTVVPLASKDGAHITAGLLETFQKQGVTPESIYSDEEGGLNSPDVIKFLQEKKGVRVIFTRTHAGMAERAIRTFKDMLFKRIGASDAPNPQWEDFIFQITLTYNAGRVHATTGYTPNDAAKRENQLEAKINMEMKAKRSRRYPGLKVGDSVKIYRKRKRGEKEATSLWSADSYRVDKTEEFNGQTFYYTSQGRRPYLRHELLKI